MRDDLPFDRVPPQRPALFLALIAGSALAGSPALAQQAGSTLPEVVVTASRVPLPAEQVGSAVTVITREEIEQRRKPLVSDLLREVPGVSVNRSGGTGGITDVRIRGAESNHTKVLIDGIEVADPSAGSFFDFAHLLSGGVERIEVLRGPQSALYGSDAIGGVVNIITPRGEGPAHATAALEGGSFRTARAAATVSGGGERYSFALTGLGYHTDGISHADEKRGNSESDSYENATGHMKLTLKPVDDLELKLVGRSTTFRDDGDGFVGGAGAVDDASSTHGRQRFARASARYATFGGAWTHEVGAAFGDQRRENFSDSVSNSVFDGKKQRFNYQSDISLHSDTVVPAEHGFTIGADYEKETVVAQSAFTDVDRDVESTGIAGEYRLGLLDRLFLSAGLRHDANDMFEDSTTWRGTAAYLFPDSGTRLHASYGTGVKNPTIFELFGFTSTFSGNPNLTPEHARGGDIGVEQQLWNDRASVDVTYFRTRIEDLITGSGNTAVNQPGTSRIDGIEVTGKVRPRQDLTLSASYTYTEGEDADGTQLIRRPKHLASADANYAFELWQRPANLNVGADYNGQRTDTAFDAFFNTSTVTLDGYTLVRAALSWQLRNGLELFGRVENLLNTRYEDTFTFGAPGRAGYLGMRASF
ncbi:MAG TPA: TonB-dependent receptor [Alphaproteobacteria bacterium]|nr:TonB-dependent receptor [Alphaproteobacteria bacterium]